MTRRISIFAFGVLSYALFFSVFLEELARRGA